MKEGRTGVTSDVRRAPAISGLKETARSQPVTTGEAVFRGVARASTGGTATKDGQAPTGRIIRIGTEPSTTSTNGSTENAPVITTTNGKEKPKDTSASNRNSSHGTREGGQQPGDRPTPKPGDAGRGDRGNNDVPPTQNGEGGGENDEPKDVSYEAFQAKNRHERNLREGVDDLDAAQRARDLALQRVKESHPKMTEAEQQHEADLEITRGEVNALTIATHRPGAKSSTRVAHQEALLRRYDLTTTDDEQTRARRRGEMERNIAAHKKRAEKEAADEAKQPERDQLANSAFRVKSDYTSMVRKGGEDPALARNARESAQRSIEAFHPDLPAEEVKRRADLEITQAELTALDHAIRQPRHHTPYDLYARRTEALLRRDILMNPTKEDQAQRAERRSALQRQIDTYRANITTDQQ